MTDAVQLVAVDGSSPEIQEEATQRAERLVREVGLANAIALSMLITEQLLTSVLHLESPMWESNVEGVGQLISSLSHNVLGHQECARRINSGFTLPRA